MAEFMHIPVLLEETIAALAVKRSGRYIDGTLGRAGHTSRILELGGEVLGIDRDQRAIDEVSAKALKGLHIVKGKHGSLKEIANEYGWNEVDGILLDLGVSSPQLDDAGRGFSFMREGPLDMRMDQSCGISAAEVVNTYEASELERIFRDYGEEREARRIARAIVKRRAPDSLTSFAPSLSEGRFQTTKELADFVESIIGRHGGHHPATRVFQALRMEVNDELGELKRALEGGLQLLKSGGRFAVITFESITDRMVKRFFAAHVGKMISLQQGGETWQGEEPRVRMVTRKARVADDEETQANPRARSAKLRVIEKE